MNFKKVWLQSESEAFSKNDTLIVKGIAIVLMVFHNCFLSPSKYAGQRVSFWPFEEASVNIVCQQLKICVCIFVFLSAYALTLSLKNAMGIFMVHTLIRRSWYYDLTYSFTNFVEIACFLVCISFIVSFVLQKAQHLLQYDRLLGMIEKKLNSIEREKDKRI